MKRQFFCILSALTILFSSCPITEETEWDKAPRLDVTLLYPLRWGLSIPIFGNISSTSRSDYIDIRKGFPFDVLFASSDIHPFKKWLAFDTIFFKSLGKWQDVLTNYTASELEKYSLDGTVVSFVMFPELEYEDFFPNYHRVQITINTETSVTIVPWCYE